MSYIPSLRDSRQKIVLMFQVYEYSETQLGLNNPYTLEFFKYDGELLEMIRLVQYGLGTSGIIVSYTGHRRSPVSGGELEKEKDFMLWRAEPEDEDGFLAPITSFLQRFVDHDKILKRG